VELADDAQRHAEIVVQLGMIGTHRQQPHVAGDRLLQPAVAMRRGSQPHLLVEAFLLPQHQRPQFGRRPLTAATATKSRHVLHSPSVFNASSDTAAPRSPSPMPSRRLPADDAVRAPSYHPLGAIRRRTLWDASRFALRPNWNNI